MPPNRRKATELATAPEAKKRLTRSSTTSAPTIQQASKTTTTTTIRKTKNLTQSKSRTKDKAKPSSIKTKSTGVENAKKPDAVSSTKTTTPTTFTITHASIKNTIQCQRYSPIDISESSDSTLVFTHGAGGTLSAPAVVNFCNGYSSLAPVIAFQGSMNLVARVKGFHASISHLEQASEGKKELVLGGRSMGARAAVLACSELLSSTQAKGKQTSLTSLILVSYPLQGPKDVRDQILVDLPASINILFVIGSRDNMCPLGLLNEVRGTMKAQSWLVVIEGMDHGMHGKGEQGLGERAGRVAADWAGGERWDGGERLLRAEDGG